MSGGTFDYKQHQIRELASQVRDEALRLMDPHAYVESDEDGYLSEEAKYAKQNWEEWGYPEPSPKEIGKAFERAARLLELAARALHDVDYLVAGDYGDDSFLRHSKAWNSAVVADILDGVYGIDVLEAHDRIYRNLWKLVHAEKENSSISKLRSALKEEKIDFKDVPSTREALARVNDLICDLRRSRDAADGALAAKIIEVFMREATEEERLMLEGELLAL